MSRSKPEDLDPLYFRGVCAASCVFNRILPVFSELFVMSS